MRGTTPWLSCVGNDDETVHVTVKMYYVGDSNLECVIGCDKGATDCCTCCSYLNHIFGSSIDNVPLQASTTSVTISIGLRLTTSNTKFR